MTFKGLDSTASSGGTDVFDYDLFNAYMNGNVAEKLFHSCRVKETVSLIPKGVERVFEYGCNTGGIAIPLAERGFDVTAYDISEANIAAIKRNAGLCKVSIEAYCRDLPAKRWPVVLLINVLEYVTDKDGVVDNIEKLLEPGGRIIFCLARPNHPFIKFSRLRGALSGRDLNDIRHAEPEKKLDEPEALQIFARHGFTVETRRSGLCFLNLYLVLKKNAA